MKKTFLVLTLLGFFQTRAQTLTASFHEPKPGDVQNSLAMDTSAFTNGMPLALTGSNLNWDFTKLEADSFVFTTNYVLPSSSSFSVDFPTATMVQKETENFQVFIRSASTPTTQTEVLGIRSTGFSTTFTDVAIAAKFPITMGSSHTDNIAGTFSYSTYNGTVKGQLSSTADGTGTLTLPDGFVYKQVLRVKTVQTLTASVIIPVGSLTQINYDFYDMNEKFPILGIGYSRIVFGSSVTVTGGASGNYKSFFAGISENTPANHISVYPSPANDQVVLSCTSCTDNNSSYEIVDALGRVVVEQSKLGSLTTVDVSKLETGIYSVIFRVDGRLRTKKLLVE